MRRRSSNKTSKAVAKRFKITGTGKVLRRSSGMRHLLSCKNSKRRRNLGQAKVLDASDTARVLENLPFSR